MALCQAQDDHCCYIEGGVCPHLRDDGPDAGRRWLAAQAALEAELSA